MPEESTPEAAPQIVQPVTRGPSTSGAEIKNLVDEFLGPESEAPEAPETPAVAETPAAPETPAVAETPEAPAVAETPPAPPQDSGIPEDVLAPPEAPTLDVDDDDGPPAGSDPKANEAWKRVKQERRELRDKVKSAEEEATRLRATQTPELEETMQLRAQVAEYETRIGQFDLSETRAFKNKYDAPMMEAFQKGVRVLVRQGRDPAEAEKLMRQLVDPVRSGAFDQSELESHIADESFAVQGAITNNVLDYASLHDTRQAALDSWQETRAVTVEQENRDTEISLMENIEQDTASAVTAAVAEGNWMLAQSVDNQEWNEAVDARTMLVKGIVRSAERADLVKWVVEGVTAKETRELLLAERTRSVALKAENDRLTAATPLLGGAGDSRVTRLAPVSEQPRDAQAVIDAAFADAPRGHPMHG
jgi:hypothetical protein